mmetsp:Transcript_17157/g.39590  ORF Transcript_17157/g.39590 Transcript_17157/m.39590 type:complete len:274 (+) Transcript_17157:219-1040(+)
MTTAATTWSPARRDAPSVRTTTPGVSALPTCKMASPSASGSGSATAWSTSGRRHPPRPAPTWCRCPRASGSWTASLRTGTVVFLPTRWWRRWDRNPCCKKWGSPATPRSIPPGGRETRSVPIRTATRGVTTAPSVPASTSASTGWETAWNGSACTPPAAVALPRNKTTKPNRRLRPKTRRQKRRRRLLRRWWFPPWCRSPCRRLLWFWHKPPTRNDESSFSCSFSVNFDSIRFDSSILAKSLSPVSVETECIHQTLCRCVDDDWEGICSYTTL